MTKRYFTCIIFLIFSVVTAATAFAADVPVQSKSEELPGKFYVTAIEVKGLHLCSIKELLDLMDIRKGETTTVVRIDEGVKRAFKKEIFEDITVLFKQDKDAGLDNRKVISGRLLIEVREHKYVNEIDIKGNIIVDDNEIYRALLLKEGDILRENMIRESIEKVREALRNNGFPDADVTIDVIETDSPQMFDLLVNIKEGAPLIIKEIRVEGAPPWLKAEMKTVAGDIYNLDSVKKDLDRLREFLINKGYVNPTVGPFVFKNGVLTIRVKPGRKLLVSFEGNSFFNNSELKEIISLKGTTINKDVMAEASVKIVKAYHKEGYIYALVSPSIREDEEAIKVKFYINEGKRFILKSISFQGNTLPAEKLKEAMLLQEGDVYNPDLLDGDIDTILSLYKALGYMDVRISDIAVTPSDTDETVRIEIAIHEGKPYTVKRIDIFGNSALSSRELNEIIAMIKGEPFNELALADLRRMLLRAYRKHGYLDAVISTSTEYEEEGVVIKVEVREGIPYYFGKTIVKGNRTTRTEVILRELNYTEGMPLNPRLLPELSKRLYQLGLFSDINIEALEPYPTSLMTEEHPHYGNRRDILIEVKERKHGVVEFGFGYGEYEQMRGFFDIRYNNLWGMNRTVGMRGELSGLKQRLIFNYYEPYFLNKKMLFRTIVQFGQKKEKNLDTGEIRYRLRRYSADVSLQKNITDTVKVELNYGYALVKTYDVQPDVILSRDDTGTLAISSLRPGLIYDSRDNPFNPHRGVFAGASFKIASRYLLGETDFLKLNLHWSIYHELSRRFIAALSFRGGIAQGFRNTRELPLIERYFLGGRDSVRGFSQDNLGPKGEDGSPTGGNAFIVSNLELRIDIGKGFGIVTFVDAGNVWQKISDVKLSLRYTAGIGLRYNTPVGPIRLDYGHKLNRRSGESSGEFHFSIGHAF